MDSSKQSQLKLRPSDAHRWMRCQASPGYVVANADRIPKQSTVYSDEGSLAHEYAEKWLKGESWTGEDVPLEMIENVGVYVKYVRKKLADTPNSRLMVESSYPLFYKPDSLGVTDAAIVSDFELHIVDLKYGEGVSVEAENNEQLLIYLANVAKACNRSVAHFSKISITIIQPRARDGRVERTWEPHPGEAYNLINNIAGTAETIMAYPNEKPFAPSDETCQFCPAKEFCEARSDSLLSQLPVLVEPESIDSVVLQKPNTLTVEQLAKVFLVKKSLVKWLENVENYLLALHAEGHHIPGTKVVAGRGGNRAWADEEAAFKLLRPFCGKESLLKTKLVSPAEVEKLLKSPLKPFGTRAANKLQSLITKPEGKPTLVSETDPREAIDLSVAQLENLDEIEKS